MLNAFKNMLKVKELRQKLYCTLALIALVRLIQNIPLPGIDVTKLQNLLQQSADAGGKGLLDTFNLFSGGALERFAIGVLGIMPYITASIVMQLMTPIIPQLEKLQKESEQGRQKIQQYTRYLTMIICVVQGAALAATLQSDQFSGVALLPGWFFTTMTVLCLTGAAFLIMWIGEVITEKGLGQGASLIITISIISSMPQAVGTLYEQFQTGKTDIVKITLLVALFFAITAAVVALVEALRKIPLKYAQRNATGKATQIQTSYLPLKVNHAGVMPIIFAGALMMFPGLAMQKLDWSWLAPFSAYGEPGYIALFAVLILGFTFFWVATQFNPIQVADDLKNSGGFIPGYRPGESTSDFLNYTMSRITVAGAIFLTIVAIIPMFLNKGLQSSFVVSQFFGGTSLLIMVGVVLQTMQQIEVQMVQNTYEDYVDNSKLRTRTTAPTEA